MPAWRFGLPSCCCSPCNYTVTVTLCCGESQSGSTVTISSGGTTVATGTTNSSGVVVLALPGTGTYTRTVSHAGYTTDTQTVGIGCNSSVTVPLDFCFFGTALGCYEAIGDPANVLSGVSVTLKSQNTGSVVYSTVTGADGKWCTHVAPPANGDYYVAVLSRDRFQTLTQNMGNNSFHGPVGGLLNGFRLQTADGYICCGTKCPVPIPSTLHATIDGASVTLINGQGCYTKSYRGWTFDSYCNSVLATINVPFTVQYYCPGVGPGGRTMDITYPFLYASGFSTDPTCYPTRYRYSCYDGNGNVTAGCIPIDFACGDYGGGGGACWNIAAPFPPGCSACAQANTAEVYSTGDGTSCTPFSDSGTATNSTPYASIPTISWSVSE